MVEEAQQQIEYLKKLKEDLEDFSSDSLKQRLKALEKENGPLWSKLVLSALKRLAGGTIDSNSLSDLINHLVSNLSETELEEF